MINKAKYSRKLNTGNINAHNHQPQEGDDEKDKKCPHCDEKFYFSSGVEMHLTHAHGVPSWPLDITDNAVDNSKSMTNQPPSRLELSMSGRNSDTMQGTDI